MRLKDLSEKLLGKKIIDVEIVRDGSEVDAIYLEGGITLKGGYGSRFEIIESEEKKEAQNG